MSTPNTPMERAEDHALKTCYISDRHSAVTNAYLAGDADRERLMKEGASRGFIRCTLRKPNSPEQPTVAGIDYGERKIPFGQMIDMVETGALAAASADRQELVACVLEMAKECEWFRDSPALKNYADLINKLKAEKDTL